MSSPHDTETGPEAGHDGPRVTRDEIKDLGRLRRSRTDRKISGVAGGIARHLDVDPLLVRVAFVILTFFGGGGILLYGVAWVLVPEDETEDTVIRTDESVRTVALIVAGVLAVASVVGDSFGGLDFPWPLMLVGLALLVVFGGKQAKENRAAGLGTGTPPPAPGTPGAPAAPGAPTYTGYRPGPVPPPRPRDPRKRGPLLFPFTLGLTALALGVVATLHLAGVDVTPSAYPATALGVVGTMLLVGAFYGRAGGLILLGLVAAVATAGTAALDDVSAGQRTATPRTAAALQESYDLGVGEIVLDLSRMDAAELGELDGRKVDLDLDVGHLRVIVPDEGLRVAVDASIDVGEVVLFGEKSETSVRDTFGEQDAPTLEIDADMHLGQIEVMTRKEAA